MDPSGDQPNWNESIQRFFEFIKRDCALEVVQHDEHAGSATEETRPFMPIQLIRTYFAENKYRELNAIYSALFSSRDYCDSSRQILERYTAVFCTLLESGRGKYIKYFLQYDSLSDAALPFSLESPPAHLPKTPGDPTFLQDICREQWRFCAPILDNLVSDRHFENERILPIISKTILAGGGTATLWLIKVHPDYNELVPKVSAVHAQTTNLFVLKEYSTNDAHRYYDNETAAFNKVLLCPHIIGYYGSFRRGGKFNVLLEYADQGTLKQFFERKTPPMGRWEVIGFWKRLFGLINALRVIHEVKPFSGDGPQIFQGWHQDVKPENVLVVSNGSKDPYSWIFKLADLGISHFKNKLSAGEDPTASDSYGTRTYGAPECSRPDAIIARGKLRVRQNIDIWSLGCIFSEAVRWLAYPQTGILDYHQERLSETSQHHAVAGIDCFHNGQNVLEAVQSSHNLARDRLKHISYIIDPIIDMINNMLEVSEKRPTAETLWRKQLDIIDMAIKHQKAINYRSTLPNPEAKSFDGGSPYTTNRAPYLAQSSTSGRQVPPIIPPEYRNEPLIDDRGPTHRFPVEFPRDQGGENDFSLTFLNGIRRRSPDQMSEDTEQAPVYRMNSQSKRQHESYNSSHQQDQRVLDGGISMNPPRSSSAAKYAQYPTRQRGNFQSTEAQNIGFDSSLAPGVTGNSRHIIQSADSPPRLSITSERLDSSRPASRNYSSLSPPNIPTGNNHNGPTISQTDHNYLPRPTPEPVTNHERSQSEYMAYPLTIKQKPPTRIQNEELSEYMDLEAAMDWKSKCKSQKRQVPGLNDRLHKRLRGRDHVFLVDDSSSMAQYWDKVVKVFEALSYIVKRIDDNGLDLFFTNSDNRSKNVKKTANLISTVRAQKQNKTSVTTDINERLSEILEKYENKLDRKSSYHSNLKPLSVYVLTDGVWEKDCNAIDPIRSAVLKLQDLRIASRKIGIQFISFGNDPDGLENLAHLDDGLNLSQDIVDTEPWDGNVWKMLLGSIYPKFDRQNGTNTPS